jgi:hypothetical protein
MTKEEIIEMAIQAGFEEHQAKFDTRFELFAKMVAEKEREECAKIVEEPWQGSPKGIAEQIRARGQE